MHNSRKRVHRLAVQENIHLHQIGIAVAAQLVIKRSITTGSRFQPVKIVEDNLAQRQSVVNHYTRIIKIGHIVIFTTFFLAQLHHRAHVVLRHDNRSIYIRLLHVVDNSRIREE